MVKNHLKIIVNLNSEIETKFRLKDTYYSVSAQFSGMNFITLVFNDKKLFKRCISLKKGNKVYVSGELGNYYNKATKKTWCSLNVKFFKVINEEEKNGRRN